MNAESVENLEVPNNGSAMVFLIINQEWLKKSLKSLQTLNR